MFLLFVSSLLLPFRHLIQEDACFKSTGQMWVQDMKSALLIVRELTKNEGHSATQITTRYAQERNKIARTGRNSGEILTFSAWFLEKTSLKPLCCVSEYKQKFVSQLPDCLGSLWMRPYKSLQPGLTLTKNWGIHFPLLIHWKLVFIVHLFMKKVSSRSNEVSVPSDWCEVVVEDTLKHPI